MLSLDIMSVMEKGSGLVKIVAKQRRRVPALDTACALIGSEAL